jgi:hypothetical protein
MIISAHSLPLLVGHKKPIWEYSDFLLTISRYKVSYLLKSKHFQLFLEIPRFSSTETHKFACLGTKDNLGLFKWIPDYIFLISRIQLREFTFSTYGNHEFTILTSWIHNFNFMNLRFQLHEFIISTFKSRIYGFNVMDSYFQLHEFIISTARVHEFNFSNSWFQLHGFVEINPIIQEPSVFGTVCRCYTLILWSF